MDSEYAQMAVAQAMDTLTLLDERGTVARPAGETPFSRLISRVETMTSAMGEVGKKLEVHANTVHGAPPSESCENGARGDSRAGALGALEDALDRLERALSYVAEQAGRNCGLA